MSSTVGLSRPVSRSTELLHVSRQDSATGRRSWDSLIPDKKKGLESPGTSGPEGVADERTRFSTMSPTTAFAGTSSPWFGAHSDSRGNDTPSRALLGCTMPRSILALSERPVTYEEELEERLGLMRVSTRTLYQRLASEKKRGEELTHQLNARELTYRGVIEKMRLQYDQRFERLKNRARLLVTRCELLRGEKQQLEGRLAQAVQGAVRERAAMERRVSSLEDELDRLRSEREGQELPLLRIVEAADVVEEEAEINPEVEKRKEAEEETIGQREKATDEEVVFETPEKAESSDERQVKGELETEQDLDDIMRWRNQEAGNSTRDHYRTLCEIAVARVAWLEEMLRSSATGLGAKSTSVSSQSPLSPPSSLPRRSSSCPMLVTGSPRPRSHEEDSLSPVGDNEIETGSGDSVILRPKRDPLPRVRDTITRVKASTMATPRSVATTNTRSSMPPSIGNQKPTARSSSATIRHSLQKLLTSGRPSSYNDHSATLAKDGKPMRGTLRTDVFSDEEPYFDLFHVADAKGKGHVRRGPTKVKAGGGAFEIPMFKAKRTASLPRVELFKKFQTVGRQERDAPSFVVYTDTSQTNQPPLTKQERFLGVRLDHPTSPEKVSLSSAPGPISPETPTIQSPLTKQERILGVRLDQTPFDKVSSTSASTVNVQDSPTTLTKQERVLGVRLDRLSSDRVSSASAVENPLSPSTDFASHSKRESTESLPDKVLDVETTETEASGIKRNRSVHSTFGRLHHRRNGVPDIVRAEQKATKPPSPLDQFGKSLKQYLH